MKFLYYNNEKGYKAEKLFEVEAETLPMADKEFEKEIGVNPIKNALICVCVVKD